MPGVALELDARVRSSVDVTLASGDNRDMPKRGRQSRPERAKAANDLPPRLDGVTSHGTHEHGFVGEVLQLQAAVGNRAVGQILARSAVGSPDARLRAQVLQRQLAIGTRNYFLDDVKVIGEAHQKRRTPSENDVLDDNGLRWRHLLDPRIARLLEARERYVFPTWAALEGRLEEHWADPDDTRIPQQLSKAIEAPQSVPFAVHPDARLEVLIDQLRKDRAIGAAELVQINELDKHWDSAQTAKSRREREMALQKLWGACGPASQSLIERLFTLGAYPVRIFRRVFDGKYEARLFESMLTMPVRDTALLVIREGSIHEFTIERHANQQSFLHQGYLSGYSALWWAGKAASEEPFLSLTGKARDLIEAQRKQYGMGQRISLQSLASLLRDYLLADVHGPKSTEVWKKLPFNPGNISEEERWASHYAKASDEEAPEARPIRLELEVFALADERAARTALKAAQNGLPLVSLIMDEAARWLAGKQ